MPRCAAFQIVSRYSSPLFFSRERERERERERGRVFLRESRTSIVSLATWIESLTVSPCHLPRERRARARSTFSRRTENRTERPKECGDGRGTRKIFERSSRKTHRARINSDDDVSAQSRMIRNHNAIIGYPFTTYLL